MVHDPREGDVQKAIDAVKRGLGKTWRELRKPTKRRAGTIDAVRSGLHDTWREFLESLEPTKPAAEDKDKQLKHPRRPPVKPRRAERETQPEEPNEDRAEVPAAKPTLEPRKGRRGAPLSLRDTRDVRRAIIWAEVLKRPHPRRMRGRRP